MPAENANSCQLARTCHQILWQALFIYDRIKYKHIPGPPPTPMVGNLHTVGWDDDKKAWITFARWRKQYGSVFKWFIGQHVGVVTAGQALDCPASAQC